MGSRTKGEKLPPLAGVPVGIKDVMVTKGVRTTAGSKILGNYIPPYDCTAVARLEAAGAVVLGKLNCDEFAMGSSNENSAFKPVHNPRDLSRVPGGSSGGSAASVAADMAVIALGSDTGGSIRQPASFCGVVGLKPTYGRVSRYGLIAFASSLDHIGPLTKTVKDAAIVLRTIAGRDPMDSTSAELPVPDYVAELDKPVKGMKVGVAKEYLGEGLDAEVRSAIEAAIQKLASLGCEIVEVSLPHTKYAIPAYYLVATAEASSNLARFDGVRYGYRAENVRSLSDMYRRSRNQGFGTEVKRRIMLGTYALSAGYYDAYYLKAQRVRTLLTRDFEEAFKKVDAIVGAHVSHGCVQARRESGRPAGHVPRRHLHRDRKPGRHPGDFHSRRPHERKAAHRHADFRQALRRSDDPALRARLRNRRLILKQTATVILSAVEGPLRSRAVRTESGNSPRSFSCGFPPQCFHRKQTAGSSTAESASRSRGTLLRSE